MRKETRQKTVTYDVYVANDGEEFSTEEECVGHEKMLSGERKICPECHGQGWVYGRYIPPYDHWDGPMGGYHETHKCEKCNGKGYLEKKVTWE